MLGCSFIGQGKGSVHYNTNSVLFEEQQFSDCLFMFVDEKVEQLNNDGFDQVMNFIGFEQQSIRNSLWQNVVGFKQQSVTHSLQQNVVGFEQQSLRNSL